MTQSGMRPMRTRESAVMFLAITLLGAACFYLLRPWLERTGWASYSAYLASLSVVFVVMLGWAAASYLAEGQLLTWSDFPPAAPKSSPARLVTTSPPRGTRADG